MCEQAGAKHEQTDSDGRLAQGRCAVFDVAGDLDALGGELCGIAYRSGNDVDALGQTLDYALGDGKGILRGRGHAAKEHVVPGVIVKCRDLEPSRQRGPQLC